MRRPNKRVIYAITPTEARVLHRLFHPHVPPSSKPPNRIIQSLREIWMIQPAPQRTRGVRLKKPKIAITKAGEARLKALEINSQPHLAKLTPQIRFQVTMSLILDVMQEMRLHLQEKFLINTMNDPTRRGRVNTYRIIPPITRKSLRDDLKNWLDGEVDKDRGVQRTGKESPSPEILTLIRERKVRIEAFRYALVLVETPAAFKYIDGKSKDIFWETLHLQKQDQYHKRFMDWASKRHPPKSTGES